MSILFSLVIITYSDRSHGGSVFFGVCLSVCISALLSARYLKNRCS